MDIPASTPTPTPAPDKMLPTGQPTITLAWDPVLYMEPERTLIFLEREGLPHVPELAFAVLTEAVNEHLPAVLTWYPSRGEITGPRSYMAVSAKELWFLAWEQAAHELPERLFAAMSGSPAPATNGHQ